MWSHFFSPSVHFHIYIADYFWLFVFVFVLSMCSFNLNVDHLIDLVVRIARERDKYHTDWMAHVAPNPNDSKFSASETPANQTAATNSDQNHLAVELADLKSKLRKLRQDL